MTFSPARVLAIAAANAAIIAIVTIPGLLPVSAAEVDAVASLGVERRIDEPVFTEAANEESQPFIAAGGPGAIVVWRSDSRPINAYSDRPVQVVRLDGKGALLDTMPIDVTPVKAPDFNPYRPRAVWSGDVALVAWSAGGEARASRVNRQGVVLDPGTLDVPGGIAIAALGVMNGLKALVSWEQDYVVFWRDDEGERVARVGRDGSVTPFGGQPVEFPDEYRNLKDAAPGEDGIWAIVEDRTTGNLPPGLRLWKIDAKGKLLAVPSTLTGNGIPSEASLATRAGSVFACWSESVKVPGPMAVFARRAGRDGQWIDAAPIELRAAGPLVANVHAVADDRGYVCSWTDTGSRVRFTTRAVPASGPVGEARVPVSLATAPVQAVSLAWTGERYLAAMSRTVSLPFGHAPNGDRADGVFVRALGSDLMPEGVDATVVTRQPNRQTEQRAIATPGGAYVVWMDDRTRGNRDVYGGQDANVLGTRITLRPGGFDISSPLGIAVTNRYESSPAVEWNGSELAVSYRSSEHLDGRHQLQRLSMTGDLVGQPVQRAETELGGLPLLLWNGKSYVFAQVDSSRGWMTVRRITSNGANIDPQATRVMPKSGKRFSNLNGVVVGDKIVVVFDVTTGSQSGIPTGEVDVQAIIVGQDGVPSMDPVMIASAAGRQDRPAVANDGTNLMVLWRDVGGGGSRIIARRFTHELTPIAGEAVVAESGTSVVSAPALSWTGKQFVAAWAEPQEAATVFSACVVDSATGCISKSQTQIKEALFPAILPGREGDIPNLLAAPSLVWSPSGGVWLYGRIDTAPHVGTVRVYARGLSLGAAGSVGPDAGANGMAADAAGDPNSGGHSGDGSGPRGSVGGAEGDGTNGGSADMKSQGDGCSCRLAPRRSPSHVPWNLLLAGLGLVVGTRAVRRIKR